MTHLNRVFGAHVVSILTGQYEDPEGQAIYYRIPLGAIAPDPVVKQDVMRRRAAAGDDDEVAFDLASRPDPAVRALDRRRCATLEAQGLLYGPAVNKLTLMNYVTPATVRALEWLGALVPELPHIYLDVLARRERSTRRCA